MSKMVKTDIPNYYKKDDGCVINTNNAELEQYMAGRDRIIKERDNYRRVNALEEKVEGLDNKLDLILEKLSNG